MTSRNDFSEKEWKLLVFSPSFTANGIASADGSITKDEALAITQSLLGARNQFPKNHLIYLILTDLPKMIENQDFPGELRYVSTLEEAQRAFKKLGKLVDARVSAEEAKDYKEFIASIADTVAKASGSLLKLFGKPVSPEECEYCNIVKNAFGLPVDPT